MDIHSDDIQSKLTDEEKAVLIGRGTEAPFSGKYLSTTDKGVYTCKACGAELFTSEDKLDSEKGNRWLRGWPSFSNPAVAHNIGMRPDNMYGMERTEIYCKTCGGHLGHLFRAEETNEESDHYCVNSVCLDFKKDESN